MNRPVLINGLASFALQGAAAYIASQKGRRWWVWWLASGAAIWAMNIGFAALTDDGDIA